MFKWWTVDERLWGPASLSVSLLVVGKIPWNRFEMMLFWNFHSPGKAIRGWKCLLQSTFKLAALLWVPEVKTPLKKLLFHLKDVYLKWHAKSSEETNYIWSSTNKVLPLLCSNGLKTEAYLEWYVKDSDSLGNRHPRVFGSRFFICIRPCKF